MTANHLHDPEAIEVENGARPAKTVKSAVTGLIGTAPTRDVNTLVQCLSERDAAAFDSQFANFTIPQALDAIYDHGASTVLVTNVLDPAEHKTATEDKVATSDRSIGQAKLAHPVVADVVVKNSKGSATCTANTDYHADAQAGMLTSLGKAIETGDSMKVSYEYADPSKVIMADVIDRVSSAGNRAGMELLNDSFNLYGYFTRILTAPVFYTQKSVVVKSIAMAEKLDAIAYIDVPVGTTFAQALAGCDPEDTINFNTGSGCVHLCYPRVKVYDPVTNTGRLEPLSQHAADLHARVDLDKGYWWSSSNQEILGITSVEHQLSAAIDSPQSEVNLLNEQGIITAFGSYGSGLRLWGNQTVA